jgi:hypothetical protein
VGQKCSATADIKALTVILLILQYQPGGELALVAVLTEAGEEAAPDRQKILLVERNANDGVTIGEPAQGCMVAIFLPGHKHDRDLTEFGVIFDAATTFDSTRFGETGGQVNQLWRMYSASLQRGFAIVGFNNLRVGSLEKLPSEGQKGGRMIHQQDAGSAISVQIIHGMAVSVAS